MARKQSESIALNAGIAPDPPVLRLWVHSHSCVQHKVLNMLHVLFLVLKVNTAVLGRQTNLAPQLSVSRQAGSNMSHNTAKPPKASQWPQDGPGITHKVYRVAAETL